MNNELCYRCKGKLHDYNSNELRKRFSNGVQEYLCDVCAEGANAALLKSREFYGIDKAAFTIALTRFKIKNGIPLNSRCTAMQNDLLAQKREALLRLMFWMDIRAVKKYLLNNKK